MHREVVIRRLFNGEAQVLNDLVAVEREITLFLNEKKVFTFFCTPKDLVELATGHLITEGLVSEVHSVQILGNSVYTEAKRGTFRRRASDIKIKFSDLLQAVEELNDRSQTFKLTGGTHAAGFFINGYIRTFEDVGRHNSVDKCIGGIITEGLDPSKALVVVSCRLSLSIVRKICAVGVPILASISAPTDLAVDLAEKEGITLVGFVRNGRMNVYSHPERIELA